MRRSPGDLIARRIARSAACCRRTIEHPPHVRVLLPPVESGQYTSIALVETLVLEGIAASIGSIGDAYDNALTETTIGLFKTEAIGRGSPFLSGPLRTVDDVEYATMKWVDCSTIGACIACPTKSHPRNTRPPTTLNSERPSRRCLKHEAGIKPGTAHIHNRMSWPITACLERGGLTYFAADAGRKLNRPGFAGGSSYWIPARVWSVRDAS